MLTRLWRYARDGAGHSGVVKVDRMPASIKLRGCRLIAAAAALFLYSEAAHAQFGVGGSPIGIPPVAGGGSAPCNALGTASTNCHGGGALPIDITEPPYNAVCDGVTDNSTAMNNALATKRDVYIPNTTLGCAMGDITLAGPNGVFGNNSNVRPASGHSTIFKITGNPRLSSLYLSDVTNQAQISNVVSTATVSSGGTFNATSVVITGAAGPAFQIGQRIDILLDDGNWFSDFITGVSGSTISFTNGLPYTAASGNTVWASFGLIYATCGAARFTINDLTSVSPWTGVMVDCPSGGSAHVGYIGNINFTGGGRMFGVICGRGCAGNFFHDLNHNAGWVLTKNYTGDGVTTNFTFGGYRIYSTVNAGTSLTVTLNGTPTTAFTAPANGQSITFNSAPGNGVAIVMTATIYAAEGFVMDSSGNDGHTTAGNMISGAEFGASEFSCLIKGDIAHNLNNVFSQFQCGPAGTADLEFLNAGQSMVSTMFAGGSPNSVVIIGSRVRGDITTTPIVSSQPVSGLAGLSLVLDPASSFSGRLKNVSSAGYSLYDESVLVGVANATPPVSASGTCTTSPSTTAGSIQIDCGSTTGSLAANQLSSSNTGIPAWATIAGVAPSVTSCSNSAAGTHTCITLSSRTTATIAGSTVLNFAGPTQIAGSIGPAAYGVATQLPFGIGGSVTVTAGGASYANNDTITLNDGCTGTVDGIVQAHAVLRVTNSSGGVIQAGGVSVQTAGVCATPPVAPIAQLSTSGSGSGATFTPGGAAWTGNYTVKQPRFRMCEIGAGAGAGGDSAVSGASSAPGSAGYFLCATFSNQTVGGTVAYSTGAPGAGGASGGANTGGSGNATTFGGLAANGGLGGLGSSASNAAAATISSILGSMTSAAPSSSIVIDSSVLPSGVGGTAAGSKGGPSPWGAGGAGVSNGNGGNACATCFGAGGGGAASTGSAEAGGNGTGGAIVVYTDF